MFKLINLKPKLISLNQEEGWFLITALIMILFLTAIGLTVAQLSAFQYQHTKKTEYDQNADLVAEAGIEQSVYELNTNNSFGGYSSPQSYFNNSNQGMGEYMTTVTTNSDGTSKTITSTGEVFKSSSSSNPYQTRSVRVTVVGTQSSGYSVTTGPGGLILSGNSNITNSSVYVGGYLSLSGHAQIGTNSQPLSVNVANDMCPTGSNPGPTYPQVCTNGNQPISISGSAKIYGSVCATGQTNSTGISGGNGGSGLEAGCTAPVASPPTYNRQAQINSVTTTGSGSSNNYVCNNKPYTRTWPANLELTGNVTINGSCNVTISGNVYITGNLNISGSSTIYAANSVGTTVPVVIVDGTININGSSSMIANSSGTGIEFISFSSTNSCTTTVAGCTLTGNDLYNSQNTTTVNINGSAKVPGMIFDAYWGELVLSGSGNVGAVAGQTINLSGTGTVIFGTTLSSGTETWAITSYQPLY